MKCWVKSRNERNPYPLLPARNGGNSKETAGDKPEEGGDDVKSSWPLRVGLHTCYNGRYKVVSALPKVKLPTSFATHSHGVTGGVYKARERIHRSILIYDY